MIALLNEIAVIYWSIEKTLDGLSKTNVNSCIITRSSMLSHAR